MKDLKEPQEMCAGCMLYLPSIQRETCDFSGTPLLAVHISHTQVQNKVLLPNNSGMIFLTSTSSLNASKTEHAIGQTSPVRHFPIDISVISPLLFPPLAIFSEHFSMQIVNTKVKESPFLLQSSCNPSSLTEISNLGWVFSYG